MKPSEFFRALEEVGIRMDTAVLELSWNFGDLPRLSRYCSALDNCLNWADTPQGDDYWDTIHEKLRRRQR